MSNVTKMISRASLKAECNKLAQAEAVVEFEAAAKLVVRMAFLTPEEKTDLNLASFYSLNGEPEVVAAVMQPYHPMRDVFNHRGDAKDAKIVAFIHQHLQQKNLEKEISRLEALSI